jgi:putative tributyrin esterase
MALCEIHWSSKVLGKQMGMHVILPETGTPPFATFYLLHGLSDDHTIWLRRTRIEAYALAYPMIIVIPDAGRSFYTNNEQGPLYAKYLAEEVTAFVERNFPAKARRGSRAVGGLSMGGYGALRLALGYPDLYISANSHSGALRHGSRKYPGDMKEMRRIFGPRPCGSDHDLLELARRCKRAGRLPRIRIDCGIDDPLIDDNRGFHAKLEKLGVAHEYEEFPGGHNWDYWDQHVREALNFHARNMGLTAPRGGH